MTRAPHDRRPCNRPGCRTRGQRAPAAARVGGDAGRRTFIDAASVRVTWMMCSSNTERVRDDFDRSPASLTSTETGRIATTRSSPP